MPNKHGMNLKDYLYVTVLTTRVDLFHPNMVKYMPNYIKYLININTIKADGLFTMKWRHVCEIDIAHL